MARNQAGLVTMNQVHILKYFYAYNLVVRSFIPLNNWNNNYPLYYLKWIKVVFTLIYLDKNIFIMNFFLDAIKNLRIAWLSNNI